MDHFIEQIQTLSKRVNRLKNTIATEEATKTSIIMPFFQVLGYDIFNPEEFLPKFTADVGIKKGEKVDYAIMIDGKPVILIEAKAANQKLDKHDSQLFRYFGATSAKFAILTNGILYRFYTDLDEQNKMDSVPFFEFNLAEPRENQIVELAKFRKSSFDVDSIFSAASELKYLNEIKQFLNNQWENPSDEFVAFIISDIYPGKKTKNVIEKFQGLVKKALKQFLNDQVNDKLKAALANSDEEETAQAKEEKAPDVPEDPKEEHNAPQIVTTEEELEGYVLVRLLLREILDPERIYYRDNLSYFNVLLDNNIRRWICRLGLNTSNKYIQFNDEGRTTVYIETVTDIEKHRDKLIKVAQKFL
ncbi:type I restriction endonuclease [Geobacillus stearothermophilus]|uniref:type I restriction endonuclease n=1 Tax=Geobacillus stearothermophilus TaxID=1422 RepID=UPI002E228373|nr:type I restriction endonuclease [Geobacillus stearothermophilus]MED3843298.1 type I restriction endonuclease [Geobacillus stearothermophilus]MED4355378.1 type I restriction endonuclease [Geobacillus stearothermophilus]